MRHPRGMNLKLYKHLVFNVILSCHFLIILQRYANSITFTENHNSVLFDLVYHFEPTLHFSTLKDVMFKRQIILG